MITISFLSCFNIAGVAVDFMHCVCLGVTRQFVNMWMDSRQHEESFYIGRSEQEINARLQSIEVPREISRAPRSIADRNHWKATEWRAFIFYSLVVLSGILPSKYLKHFFLFVYGVYCLLGDSITEAAINSAEVCLTKFVIQVEELYGLKCCTFNVHQLIHLADSVRNCGPLWSSAAFMFESNNHTLQKMFHGTQHIPKQLVETYLITKKIPVLAKGCINEDSSPAVHNLFQKLCDVKSFHNNVALGEGVQGVGKERSVNLTASQVLAVQDLLGVEVKNRHGIMYSRFVANKKMYTSIDYVRAKRNVDRNISFEHDQYTFGIIIGLLSIKPECLCKIEELQLCNCSSYSTALVQPMIVRGRPLFRDTDFNVNSFFLAEVDHAAMQIAIYPNQINKKCMLLTLEGKQFFCPLPYDVNDN